MNYDPVVSNVENGHYEKQVADCFLPSNKRRSVLVLAASAAGGRTAPAGGGTTRGTTGAGATFAKSAFYLLNEC